MDLFNQLIFNSRFKLPGFPHLVERRPFQHSQASDSHLGWLQCIEHRNGIRDMLFGHIFVFPGQSRHDERSHSKPGSHKLLAAINMLLHGHAFFHGFQNLVTARLDSDKAPGKPGFLQCF